MEVKNGDIFMARQPLQEILSKDWPVPTAFALAKLGRKLDGPYRDIETVRQKLIRQYGTENGNGQIQIKPDSEQWTDFEVAYNELMEHTFNMTIEKVLLPEHEGIRLKPTILMAVDSFVDKA